MNVNAENGLRSLPLASSEVLPPEYFSTHFKDFSSAQQDSPLRLYYNILVKRRWTIFTCLIIVTTVGAIATFRTTPIYRSSSRLVVGAQDSSMLDFKDSNNQYPQYVDDRDLATYIKILQSQNLAVQVVRSLHLDQSATFDPLPATSGDALHSTSDKEREMALADKLRLGLAVTLVPDTKIIQIDY